MSLDQALELCRTECTPADDPIGWTLARAREIDGGSDESVWQAIAEHHTSSCIARAFSIAREAKANG